MGNKPFLDFEGMQVVVTGASSGIGRAISIELSQHGAGLILIGRNQEVFFIIKEHINSRRGNIGFLGNFRHGARGEPDLIDKFDGCFEQRLFFLVIFYSHRRKIKRSFVYIKHCFLFSVLISGSSLQFIKAYKNINVVRTGANKNYIKFRDHTILKIMIKSVAGWKGIFFGSADKASVT